MDIMNVEKHILFLRLSYWIPAVADFVIAYLALNPQQMGLTNTVYPMGLTSVIAFSWGVMLLIADRQPMERRWILIPTILVVCLLTSINAFNRQQSEDKIQFDQ
jgi:hypothetical protein